MLVSRRTCGHDSLRLLRIYPTIQSPSRIHECNGEDVPIDVLVCIIGRVSLSRFLDPAKTLHLFNGAGDTPLAVLRALEEIKKAPSLL